MTIDRTDYVLTAVNGEPINGTRHVAAGVERSHGAVLLVPAMATPARHYFDLADWFVERGYTVHTFDYQGYGASARTTLDKVDADILTWAKDAAVEVPLTSISFTDDETMSARATRHLESWYSGAPLQTRRFEPTELGTTHITHMGPIKSRNSQIWQTIFSHMDTAA